MATNDKSNPDLRFLDLKASLSDRIDKLFEYVAKRFDFVDHISVVIYDPETTVLKSFLSAGSGPSPLQNYQTKLKDAQSLKDILKKSRPRVIDDLSQLPPPIKTHTRRLIDAGYRSSYTIPMYIGDEFYGFVFYNSLTSFAFAGDVVAHLDPIARLLALIVIQDIRSIRTLTAATQTARHITTRRDCETGAHLERMSRYSRLIAEQLAIEHKLSDEVLEHIFLFAPLHDIGKIAIPDSILLKPGPLTGEEYQQMQTHSQKGLEMINYMLSVFNLSEMSHVDILRNIVFHHHESFDGTGYPKGLSGDAIPLEARIIAAADVFDALSSPRPYKEAWSNDKTFDEIKRIAKSKLDPLCVEALIGARHNIEQIQQQFQESVYG